MSLLHSKILGNTKSKANGKKGVVPLILAFNRGLWICEDLNCHVNQKYSAVENEPVLTEGHHDRIHELT